MNTAAILLFGLVSSTFLIWIMWQTNGTAVLEAKRFSSIFRVLLNAAVEMWPTVRIILIFSLLAAVMYYSYASFSKYFDASRHDVKIAAEYCNARSTCADYKDQIDSCPTNDDPSKCLIGRLGAVQKQKVEFICKADGSLRVESKYSSLSDQDCNVYQLMDRVLP